MKENAVHFSLAYSLPIFDKSIIKKIGTIRQTTASHDLIHKNIQISTENNHINHFLPLLYQPNYTPTPTNILLKRWNNYWRSSKEKQIHHSQVYILGITKLKLYQTQ